jgi:hypothetical protein
VKRAFLCSYQSIPESHVEKQDRRSGGLHTMVRPNSVFISDQPDKAEVMDGIYKNPKYYSGYILFDYPGSPNMMGDVTAEQNCSPVAAYIGDGAAWTILENIA